MDPLFSAQPEFARSVLAAVARGVPAAGGRGVPAAVGRGVPAPAARGVPAGAGRSVPPAQSRSALFNEDFDLPPREATAEPEVINPTYSAADLAEARSEAWAAGHAVGTTDATTTTAATTLGLLDSIATALRDARAQAGAVAERSVESIARLLLDSLAKLLPALCERHGEAEVCALIRIILPALAQEPTITVRVNPAHTPALMRELDRLDPDLVEHVRLVPIEAIAAGNVRVSWRDGSALRDTAALWQQVRGVLEPAGLLSPATAPISPGAAPISTGAVAVSSGNAPVSSGNAPAPDSTMAPDRAPASDPNNPASAPDSMPASATRSATMPATIKEAEHVA